MTEAHSAATGSRPRVTVLMATFNGRRWIDAQVDSILGQRDVDVRLVVSDDGSADGTREHLLGRASRDPRIEVLEPRQGPPGVTANFLHLFVRHVPDASFVAFCDQDDVWHADKLIRELAPLLGGEAEVCSSDVVAVEADGTRRLIRKSRPQRKWDHIFEAAGPGSTYVFSPEAHSRLCAVLEELDYSEIGVHDWYLYALARAIGLRWRILSEPTLDYRQHEGNVQGANSGTAARRARVSKLRDGFYLRQFILTARAVRRINTYSEGDRRDLERLLALLESGSFPSRLAFFARWPQIRRSRLEGFELAGARLAALW